MSDSCSSLIHHPLILSFFMILCGDNPDAMVLAFLLDIKTDLHRTRRFPLVHGYYIREEKEGRCITEEGPTKLRDLEEET